MTRIPDPYPEPLTVDEVARALKRNPRTIRKAILAGELPGMRIGRNFSIPREAFALWQRQEWRAPQASDFIHRRKAS